MSNSITPSDYDLIRTALQLFANEQTMMAFTSSGEPELHDQMINHCTNTGRANDALAALERLQHKIVMWEATHA